MPRGRPRKSDEVLMKSAEFIGWALGGLEREIANTRERLAGLTAQAARLRARVGRPADASATAGAAGKAGGTTRRRRKRGRMSAEARKRMSDMMTKRWEEWRKKHKKKGA